MSSSFRLANKNPSVNGGVLNKNSPQKEEKEGVKIMPTLQQNSNVKNGNEKNGVIQEKKEIVIENSKQNGNVQSDKNQQSQNGEIKQQEKDNNSKII